MAPITITARDLASLAMRLRSRSRSTLVDENPQEKADLRLASQLILDSIKGRNLADTITVDEEDE